MSARASHALVRYPGSAAAALYAEPIADGRTSGTHVRRDRRAWRVLAARIEHGDTYVLVFALLLITYFFLSLAPDATWSRVFGTAAVGATLLITLRTSKASILLRRAASACVAAGLVATLVGSLIGVGIGLVFLVIFLLLLVTPFVILNRILRHSRVTIETIAGAIDVYVLLGLIFSALYRVIAQLSGTSFFVQAQHATTNQYLYFSFVSLTTVGYGDLTAATKVGRSVVVLEPLLGQIFLVTTVARLVSIFQPNRRRSTEET